MYQKEIIYIFRILVAGACGIVIGFERKNRLKEAGIRTHCLVACGAALMMVLSKYSFYDLAGDIQGIRGADPARIASQVVSGIGFLGAGMIFVHKNTITGLTTAAGIWATAGIGMAFGAGLYIIGAVVTVIVVIVQTLFHLNIRWMKTPITKTISIYGVSENDYQTYIVSKLRENGIAVHEISIRKSVEDNTKNYKLLVELSKIITEDEIISLIEYDAEIKANN